MWSSMAAAAAPAADAMEEDAPVHRPSRKRPLIALTLGLRATYDSAHAQRCREAEAAPQQHAPPRRGGVRNHGYDDENCDYIVESGEEFGGRYTVLGSIGTGSFSKVYRARDTVSGQLVALKVVKSKPVFMAQAQAEIELLQLLLRQDPDGRHNCTRLLDTFWHRGHQCLVFEVSSALRTELLFMFCKKPTVIFENFKRVNFHLQL
jgi:dual specificity protein kinase YAK1